MSTEHMASLLRRADLPAKVNLASDETADDEVVIATEADGNSLAVQCGAGYYSLNYWNEAEGASYHLAHGTRATDMVEPAKAAFAKHFPELANAKA